MLTIWPNTWTSLAGLPASRDFLEDRSPKGLPGIQGSIPWLQPLLTPLLLQLAPPFALARPPTGRSSPIHACTNLPPDAQRKEPLPYQPPSPPPMSCSHQGQAPLGHRSHLFGLDWTHLGPCTSPCTAQAPWSLANSSVSKFFPHYGRCSSGQGRRGPSLGKINDSNLSEHLEGR